MGDDARKFQVRLVGRDARRRYALPRENGLLRRAWNLAFRQRGWRSDTASMPISCGNG